MTLLNFETHVNSLSKNRDGEIFLNSGMERASIVVGALFRVAKKSMDIYSGCLDGGVYTQDMFASLLDEQKIQPENIRVIVTEPDKVKKENKELVTFLNGRGILVKSFEDIGRHLIVADGDCYRFEHDHENKKAFFAFGVKNDTDAVLNKLQKAFENMWNRADSLMSVEGT